MSAIEDQAALAEVFRVSLLQALGPFRVGTDKDTLAELTMATNALWLAMEKMIEGAIDEHKAEVKHG